METFEGKSYPFFLVIAAALGEGSGAILLLH